MATKYITTKFGVKIDVTGLSSEQVAKVRSAAEAKGNNGAKGASLAKQIQVQAARQTAAAKAATANKVANSGLGAEFSTAGKSLDELNAMAAKYKGKTGPVEKARAKAISEAIRAGGGTPADGGVSTDPESGLKADYDGLGIKGNTGQIDPKKAVGEIASAAADDTTKNFQMQNPESQTDWRGNTQQITTDPVTGKTSIVQTPGAAGTAAQNAFMSGLNNFQSQGPLNFSQDIQGLKNNQMNLSGDINSLRASGAQDLSGNINSLKNNQLDLSGDINALKAQGPLNLSGYQQGLQNDKLNLSQDVNALRAMGPVDLSGAPKLLQSDDVRLDAEAAADANYKYITKTYAQEKEQEMKAARQMLEQRGIPLDPNPNSLYGRTLQQLDQKYQGLDDQAKNQAISKANETLGARVGAQSMARDSFVNSALGANSANLQQFGALTGAQTNQYNANLQGYNSLANMSQAQDASQLARFGAATGAQSEQNKAFLANATAQQSMVGQQDASKLANFGALTGAQTTQQNANLANFGAITGAQQSQYANNLQGVSTMAGVAGSMAPNFTQYQGGTSTQAPNLQALLSTISDADLAKYGIDQNVMTQLKQIAASKENAALAAKNSGGGGDSGPIIGGSAP